MLGDHAVVLKLSKDSCFATDNKPSISYIFPELVVFLSY